MRQTGESKHTYLLRFEELYGLKRLLDVGDFLLQTRRTSLRVDFHELILADHLLEALHRAINLRSRGDIVLDFVHKRRLRDTAGICRRIFAKLGSARCISSPITACSSLTFLIDQTSLIIQRYISVAVRSCKTDMRACRNGIRSAACDEMEAVIFVQLWMLGGFEVEERQFN